MIYSFLAELQGNLEWKIFSLGKEKIVIHLLRKFAFGDRHIFGGNLQAEPKASVEAFWRSIKEKYSFIGL